MKVVASLPDDIIEKAERYLTYHKSRGINKLWIFPMALMYLSYVYLKEISAIRNFNELMPWLDVPTLFAIFLSILLVLCSKLLRILWRFDKLLWIKYLVTFGIGLANLIFSWSFDFNHWLLHEYGYLTDDPIGAFVMFFGYIPLFSVHWNSFDAVEHAFYKSEGYDYEGRLR